MTATYIHRPVVLVLVLSALLVAGCEAFGGRNANRQAGLRDDIVAIRQYYSTQPWTWDPEGRVNGILARVYFLPAAEIEGEFKGVFVPSPIRAQLHTLTQRPDGSYARDALHVWVLTEEQARPFRTIKPSILGDSYAFVLRWPTEVKVAGREIQITFSYERQDGRVVSQPSARFRVPVPGKGIAPGPESRPVVRPGRAPATPPPPGEGKPSEPGGSRTR